MLNLFWKCYFIEVYSWLTILWVSGVQQSDSVIQICVSILFQILFPFRLLQNAEQSSLCYRVGPWWLSILNIAVCTCQSQTLSLSHPHILPLVTLNSFTKSMSLFLCCKQTHFFLSFFFRFCTEVIQYDTCWIFTTQWSECRATELGVIYKIPGELFAY